MDASSDAFLANVIAESPKLAAQAADPPAEEPTEEAAPAAEPAAEAAVEEPAAEEPPAPEAVAPAEQAPEPAAPEPEVPAAEAASDPAPETAPAAEPQAASPKAASPKAASPKAASPKAAKRPAEEEAAAPSPKQAKTSAGTLPGGWTGPHKSESKNCDYWYHDATETAIWSQPPAVCIPMLHKHKRKQLQALARKLEVTPTLKNSKLIKKLEAFGTVGEGWTGPHESSSKPGKMYYFHEASEDSVWIQ